MLLLVVFLPLDIAPNKALPRASKPIGKSKKLEPVVGLLVPLDKMLAVAAEVSLCGDGRGAKLGVSASATGL